jgi:hypothetical protein
MEGKAARLTNDGLIANNDLSLAASVAPRWNGMKGDHGRITNFHFVGIFAE